MPSRPSPAARLASDFGADPSREADIAAALAEVAAARDVSIDEVGLLGGIDAHASRGPGRALRDRIRIALEDQTAAEMVHSGAARLIVREAGMDGALMIASGLLSAPCCRDDGGWRLVGVRALGQVMLDSLVGGTDELDAIRDDAHGWIDWWSITDVSGPADDVDRQMLHDWQVLMDAAGIDADMAHDLLRDVVDLVERDGPRRLQRVSRRQDVLAAVKREVALTFGAPLPIQMAPQRPARMPLSSRRTASALPQLPFISAA